MENEIDKIFKKGLENKVEPTFESDWQAFEKSLKSAPFYKSGWFLGILALVVVATLGISVYTSLHNEEPMYSSRTHLENTPVNEGSIGISKDSIDNVQLDQNQTLEENELSENSNHNLSELEDSESAKANSAQGQGETDLNNSEGGIVQNATDKSISEKDGLNTSTALSSPALVAASANDKTDRNKNLETSQHDSSLAADDKTAVKDKSAIGQKASISQKESAAAANNQSAIGETPAKTQQSRATNSAEPHSKAQDSEMSESKQGIDGSENDALSLVPFTDVMPIIPLGGNVTRESLDSEMIQNSEPVDPLKIKSFDYAIFFGIAQNTILKTSPSFGVSVRKHFSKWTVEVGVAYQQSGKLGWSQQSDAVSYGFARYENSIQVRTNKIDLLSLPIKLRYRVGGQSQIFVGFAPSILVNAHQEKLVFNDGSLISNSTEKGYLYKTGAPELIYFLSAGYTYSLNEQFQFNFGLNYSFQQWNISEKQPMGGFVKLYYTLR